ncbi:M23 family metallopeptidase [Georgenia subflava]|uniref:Peptidoglycan DD-metalloendopeptidase family protein n=1 Tax=Georgenia subflava TaxID=1622177 RepID=A0A6N7EM96_9MICO|nr:M23 family metallopeptidase [Georgenia subflava]MPV38203.1 peptidoglycan DD-metalloendopeptidase family protein [Georgenia subflava]
MTSTPRPRPALAVLLAVAGLALSSAAVAGPAAGGSPAGTLPRTVVVGDTTRRAAPSTAPGALLAGHAAAAVTRAESDAAGAAAGGPAPASGPSGASSPSALLRRAAPAGDYRWPTGAEADLVRDFDAPEAPWGPGHRGVDLELAAGSTVHAAADGVVVFAGTVVDRPVVSVEHPDGVRTTYEPVSPAVVAGQRVRAGDVLGELEAGHCPPWELTTCLHWGARTSARTYVDPMDLLGVDVVVRLLPATMDLAG